jgi:hypothetical protein
MKNGVKWIVAVATLVFVTLLSIPAQAVTYYPVTITVIERSDGKPVEGAGIVASGPMYYSGVTNAYGQVTFNMVASPTVRYHITAAKKPTCGADVEDLFVTGPVRINLYLEKVTVKVMGTNGCGAGGYEYPVRGIHARCVAGQYLELETDAKGEAVFWIVDDMRYKLEVGSWAKDYSAPPTGPKTIKLHLGGTFEP